MPHGTWDLSSLIKDQIHAPALEIKVLTTGPPGKIQVTYDPVTDWEGQLPASVKDHERVSYHLSLAQKNIKIQ